MAATVLGPRPGEESIATGTTMAAVTLRVADLDAMAVFYREGVGLHVVSESASSIELGLGARPVLVLEHTPALRHAGPGEAGLYHVAIVFDTRSALAAAVLSTARRYPESFMGSADHLVSEAFYFADPEGNGLELYWDRDRTQWSWMHGRIVVGAEGLDPHDYLRRHVSEAGLEGPLVDAAGGVGHVHLSIGDTSSARDFYVGALGFAEPIASPTEEALFVSAGGYHHHLALNTWGTRGAGRRRLALGLGRIDIELPVADDIAAVADRLRHYRVPVRDDGRSIEAEDPWANVIRITPRTAQ